MNHWKLVEFNEELGKIAAHAHGCGPQCVTVNDKVDVVVLSPAEYARLSGEPLPKKATETGTDPGLNWVAALRRPFEEAAARGEDVFWPWDWDCEKREWVLPVDDAVSP
jgi:hypothetical protein